VKSAVLCSLYACSIGRLKSLQKQQVLTGVLDVKKCFMNLIGGWRSVAADGNQDR
jgi:hypothetical protein